MNTNSMYCYIVRIYRRISNGDGEEDTVVGLVEKVGGGVKDKKFTSYSELVDVLQNDQSAEQAMSIVQESEAAMSLNVRKPTASSGDNVTLSILQNTVNQIK